MNPELGGRFTLRSPNLTCSPSISPQPRTKSSTNQSPPINKENGNTRYNPHHRSQRWNRNRFHNPTPQKSLRNIPHSNLRRTLPHHLARPQFPPQNRPTNASPPPYPSRSRLPHQHPRLR